MHVLLKIAWRNIWRNPRRSWVLITTVAIGIFGYMGSIGFNKGFLYQMVDSSINLMAGHIKIAAKGFHSNPLIRTYISAPAEIEAKLRGIEGIAFAPQVTFQGMINSSETAAGVIIAGVIPERESKITTVSRLITAGDYFTDDTLRNEIVIGEGLAERLHVELGEKVVLLANDLHNNISSGAYRIAGLFRSASTDFDKTNVFLRLNKARELVGYTDQVSTISIRLDRDVALDEAMHRVSAVLADPSLEILSWEDRYPILVLSLKSFLWFSLLFILIVFTAIAFSIINSYLMVIYERIREIGIMMAIGTFPKNIRWMLFFESVFISSIGIVVGGILGGLMIAFFRHYGLDLSFFADSLGKYGVGHMLYPEIGADDIFIGWLAVQAIVMLASLYPAWKASRFQAVDALRHV